MKTPIDPKTLMYKNAIAEVGKRYGKLVVTGVAYREGNTAFLYCDCDCGTKNRIVRASSLRKGVTKSCGCLRSVDMKHSSREEAKKYVGQKFNRLTVTEIIPAEETKDRGTCIYCRVNCDCGAKEHIAKLANVLSGRSKSCGHCSENRKKNGIAQPRRANESKAKGYIGRRFGRLVVTGVAGLLHTKGGKHKAVYVICDCDCGKKNHLVSLESLRWRDTQSCGCLKEERLLQSRKEKASKVKPVAKQPKPVRHVGLEKAQELVGKRFGHLVVRGVEGYFAKPGTKTKNVYLRCDCDCGTKDHLVARYSLVKDKTKSCGCMQGGHTSNRLKKADGNAIETAIKKAKAAPKKKTTSLYTTDPLTNGGYDLSAQRLISYWEELDKETLCLAWQTPEKFAAWGIRNGFVNGRKLVRRDSSKKHNPVNSYWR